MDRHFSFEPLAGARVGWGGEICTPPRRFAMSAEKVLTKEIAEQFIAGDETVYLSQFTTIEDAAAESLSNHETKFTRWHINLDNLPASAAQILRDAGCGE
jgi:hypothetical protein